MFFVLWPARFTRLSVVCTLPTTYGGVVCCQNARQLPTATPAERQQQAAELRMQFPVSSGTVHKDKEADWVPVEKDDIAPPPPPKPAPKPAPQPQPKPTGMRTSSWLQCLSADMMSTLSEK